MEVAYGTLMTFSMIFFWAIIPGMILSIAAYICSGILSSNRNKRLYQKVTGIRKGVVAMLVFVCISLAFCAGAVSVVSSLSRAAAAYAAEFHGVVITTDIVVLVMCIAALIVSSVVRNKCVAAAPAIAQPDKPAQPVAVTYVPVQPVQYAQTPVQPYSASAQQTAPVQQAASVQQTAPVQQAAPAAGKFCTTCGLPVEEGAKFCSACGSARNV